MDASERKRERDRNREDRKGATSQLERAIDNVSTSVYHIRVSHSTVVGAYDAIEAFGSSTTGKSPASVLTTVLTEAIATLRRDGHVPERTTAEVAERMTGMRGNLGMDVTLPSMTLQPATETPPQTPCENKIVDENNINKQTVHLRMIDPLYIVMKMLNYVNL